jgi:hypothetical protein
MFPVSWMLNAFMYDLQYQEYLFRISSHPIQSHPPNFYPSYTLCSIFFPSFPAHLKLANSDTLAFHFFHS